MGKPDLGNRVWIITPGHLNFKRNIFWHILHAQIVILKFTQIPKYSPLLQRFIFQLSEPSVSTIITRDRERNDMKVDMH